MDNLKLRKRYYIGLIPFGKNFYIGGISAKSDKEERFDLVDKLSYGIYHAYVDVVSKDGENVIERFGVENGSLERKEEEMVWVGKYEQTTDIFGLFDGETLNKVAGVKKGDKVMKNKMSVKSLYGTIENTEIKTNVDGIDIPARVIDNSYFIIKTKLETCCPLYRDCFVETNKDEEIVAFECILEKGAGGDGVVDAHNGYSECVNKVREDTTRLMGPVEVDEEYILDTEADFFGDDFLATETVCNYSEFGEVCSAELCSNPYSMERSPYDYAVQDGLASEVHDLYEFGRFVEEKTYDLNEQVSYKRDKEYQEKIKTATDNLVKSLSYDNDNVKPKEVIIKHCGMRPIRIEILF